MKTMKLMSVALFLSVLTMQSMSNKDVTVKFLDHMRDYPICKEVFLNHLKKEVMGDCAEACLWMVINKSYYLQNAIQVGNGCMSPAFERKVLRNLCEMSCTHCKDIAKLLGD